MKPIRIFLILGICFTLTACPGFPVLHNPPPWKGPAPNGSLDFAELMQTFSTYLQGDEFRADLEQGRCQTKLGEIFQFLYDLKPVHIDRIKLRPQALSVVEKIFHLRLALRERLKELAQSHALSQEYLEECVDSIRDVMRAARSAEDMLIEWKLDPPAFDAAKRAPMFQGVNPALLVNPEHSKAFGGKDPFSDLQSGDVIMSRFTAYTSALIARIPDRDSNFSHAAIVYGNPEDHKLYVVESWVETGAFIRPLEEYLQDLNMRAVVFRYDDPQDLGLMHRAAEWIYTFVTRYKNDTGINPPYDFRFDEEDPSELSCVEVIDQGVRHASHGDLQLPLFKSHAHLRYADFLKKVGVEGKFFSPTDFDVDTRFELIAEWREPAYLRELRLKDIILTSILEFMDNPQKHYGLVPNLSSGYVTTVIWSKRQIPWAGNWIESFPKHMDPELLQISYLLTTVGERLYQELDRRERFYRDEALIPMTAKELYEELEDFRISDLKNFQNGKSSVFHDIFRPR